MPWRGIRISSAVVNDDGHIALSGSVDDTPKLWDVENARELRTVPKHTEAVYAVALAADGRTALSTVRGKKLKLWDVDSSRELRALAGKYGSVRAVALSRDLQGARADPRSLDAAELQTHRWKWLSRGNGVQVF